MLVFGHIGITLGTAVIANQIIRFRPKSNELSDNSVNGRASSVQFRKLPGLRTAMDLIDVIFCVIGSLLPDIIDKPIGHYLLNQVFGNNGRIFSHTLLFAVVVLIASFYLYLFKGRTWGMYLSFGVFMHLILDYMWQAPQTLFWPFLGFSFPRSEDYNWFGGIIHSLLNNPVDYLTELAGLLLVGLVLLMLVRRKLIPVSNRRR